MRITELLKQESIGLNEKAENKEQAIDKLVALMEAGGRLKDKAGYKAGILAREGLGSTAIGEGIAIPHAKVEAVAQPGLAAMVLPEGVDYEAFDGSLANLIFMIAAPAEGADVHLEALARLSTLLMNPGFKEALTAAKSKEEFLRVIDEAETARFGTAEEENGPQGGAAEDILSDCDETGDRFDAMTDGKVTTITRFWKDGGTVRAIKTTKDAVVRSQWDTGMQLYREQRGHYPESHRQYPGGSEHGPVFQRKSAGRYLTDGRRGQKWPLPARFPRLSAGG